MSGRTVERQLAELERAGLVTRRFRRHKSTVIEIHEPSAEERSRYLAVWAKPQDDNSVALQDDNFVVQKKSEREEVKDVNEFELVDRGAQDFERLGGLLEHRSLAMRTTASNPQNKGEYLAHQMLRVLGDTGSLGYYRKVADSAPDGVIFEALSKVMEAARAGKVSRSKGALFVALLSNHLHHRGRTRRPDV